MTKLTDEHKDCDCHEMLKKTDVCMPEKCHIIHEDILDLYDMHQDKSKAYDDLMNANSQVVKDNISLTQLQQKNNQLKEEIHNLQQLWHDECDENEHLKENLFDKDQIGQRLRSEAHKKIPEGKNGR